MSTSVSWYPRKTLLCHVTLWYDLHVVCNRAAQHIFKGDPRFTSGVVQLTCVTQTAGVTLRLLVREAAKKRKNSKTPGVKPGSMYSVMTVVELHHGPSLKQGTPWTDGPPKHRNLSTQRTAVNTLQPSRDVKPPMMDFVTGFEVCATGTARGYGPPTHRKYTANTRDERNAQCRQTRLRPQSPPCAM